MCQFTSLLTEHFDLYSHHASYCYLFNDEVVIKTFQQGSDEINYVDKLLLHEKHV